jgi:putative GTP pyrophosphokinase
LKTREKSVLCATDCARERKERVVDRSEAERNYREKYRGLYQTLSDRASGLISQLLEEASIPISQIEHRAKTVESFLGKLDRKAYNDPFTEINDFAGIRVITYYADDVIKVADVLKNEFDVDSGHSTDKVEELGVDEFGYRSFHLVCKLKPPRSSLIEWKHVKSLQFEVQIRSVLQHAWAAISHKLDYKSASQAPTQVRRQLFRLSALLELADDEFASIRDRTEVIVETYRKDVDRGDLSIPLNIESLKEYIKERIDTREWEQLGTEMGLRSKPEYDSEVIDSSLNRLFTTLKALGINQIRDFDELVRDAKPAANNILSKIAVTSKKHDYLMFAVPLDVLNVVIAVKKREALPKDFAWDLWAPALQQTLKELSSS